MEEEKFWLMVDYMIKKRGSSYEAIARACQAPYSTFMNWKENKKLPSVMDGYMIARELGVTLEYLITGEINVPGKKSMPIRSLLKKAEQLLLRLRMKTR